jgi:RHS repeat-associated protein
MKPFLLVGVLLLSASPALAQAPVGEVQYYHTDVIGSVRAVTGAGGNLVVRHDYFPFGEEYLAAPGSDSRRFSGKERDAETALDYFGARLYRNPTGRFASIDPAPITDSTINPQRFNPYVYVLNNPVGLIDRLGLDAEAPTATGEFKSGFEEAFDEWIDGYYEQQWTRAFDALWNAYPTHDLYDTGRPGASGSSIQEFTGVDVLDTCALRLSYALNQAGFTIGKAAGRSAMRGKDGQYYLVSRLDLDRFIAKKFGFAPMLFTKPDFMGFRQAVASTSGIVSMSIHFPGSTASGHIALIRNGVFREPEHDNYTRPSLDYTLLAIRFWRMR